MTLTQEQLVELIAKIYANLVEKQEAIKAAGGTPEEITTDDIVAELETLLSEVGETDERTGETDSAATEETKEAAGEGECIAEQVSADLLSKIVDALSGIKSVEVVPEQKASDGMEQKAMSRPQHVAPMQRKYSELFINRGSARDVSGATGFKSRIEQMTGPERSKYAYGMFGRAVKCINASNGDVERAAYAAEHKFDDKEMAHEFKALSASVPADGGYLVPEVYANEIIELLYPATIIYSLGARRLGMPNGNLNIPKIKTGSRALFTGESRAISKSEPKFGNLKLSAKKLTALIPMSNDLLRSTNFDNDVIVGQDIVKQMALGVDYGALLGTGGEFQPVGIAKNQKVLNVDVTKLDKEYSSADGVLTAAFPNYLVAAVLKNNTYADGLGFAFNTSVEQYLKSIRDNVGSFIFAKEMNENGTLVGYPYRTTNLLESVGGKTQIIFGNWNDLVIGEQGALEIETSREGSWTDDAGNLISAFENDQTLIRAIDNVDIGLRHDESFAVASKVAVPV